jgi:hypothetical protein
LQYNVTDAIVLLKRTPALLDVWLRDLPADWVRSAEGPGTFSPFDVLGHLIHGEKTDWVARTRIILEYGTDRAFDPYDRFAQEIESAGKSINQLLDEFTVLRTNNLEWLGAFPISETDLAKKGMHPGLGEVTLRNLLSTWVVHDLTHIAQIGRVMAKQYIEEMGPWPQYFRILSF